MKRTPINTLEELYALPNGTICDVIDFNNPIQFATTPYFKSGKQLFMVGDPNTYLHYQTIVSVFTKKGYDVKITARDEIVDDPVSKHFLQQQGYITSHGHKYHTKWYYINQARKKKKMEEQKQL